MKSLRLRLPPLAALLRRSANSNRPYDDGMRFQIHQPINRALRTTTRRGQIARSTARPLIRFRNGRASDPVEAGDEIATAVPVLANALFRDVPVVTARASL